MLYLGRVTEQGPAAEILAAPLHPCTTRLLASIPRLDEKQDGTKRLALEGELPSPVNPPDGCVFCTRCPFARELCRTVRTQPRDPGGGRIVAYHFAGTPQAGAFPAADAV